MLKLSGLSQPQQKRRNWFIFLFIKQIIQNITKDRFLNTGGYFMEAVSKMTASFIFFPASLKGVSFFSKTLPTSYGKR